MKNISKFLNKPLPKNLCYAVKGVPDCNICWFCVIMLGLSLLLVGGLT